MKLGVVGLGKLGMPMAVLYAYKGYDVIGLDKNKELVDQLLKGECPIYETQLEQYMACMDSRLHVTTSYDDIAETDLIFIIVPTPSNKLNRFDNRYVLSAIENLGQVIREKDYCTIVITSTVMPGTIENDVKPLLEKVSGKKCIKDFGLCYNPEFIALGSVLRDMRNPDVILIGESDKYAGDLLEKFQLSICENHPPVARMSWWNAELSKISLNVFITTKISIANTITEICNKMPTGDVDAVTGFLGMDSRVGGKYLKGGLGFGGTCFPRDNRAFIAYAKQMQTNYQIQKATDEFNIKHSKGMVKYIAGILGINQNKLWGDGLTKKTISILGLTYKPNTDVTEESASVNIAKMLDTIGAKVRVYDPAGLENSKKQFNHGLEYHQEIYYADSVEDCLRDSDLCIVATPWTEFKQIDFSIMREKRVLDCWRMLDKKALEDKGVEYHALGVNG